MLLASQIAKLFPFFVKVDRELRIVDLGPSIITTLRALKVGDAFTDQFVLRRPRVRSLSFEALEASDGQLAMLTHKEHGHGLLLRGQVACNAERDAIYFLCAPALKSIHDLEKLGLSLADFAPHDSAIDALFVVQSRDAIISEAKDMAVEAESASRAKDLFLANISHELRTPMNGVLGMAKTLLEDELDEETEDAVRTIAESSHALLHILDDLLDLSKLTTGNIALQLEATDLHAIAHDVITLQYRRAQMKGLELPMHIGVDVPRHVITDETRMRQILLNFVSNAIKFTEDGDVSLTLESCGDRGDRKGVRFTVRDSGIGIPRDHLERIFAPFAQVDASSKRAKEGSGLGLAITKHLLELFGSQIEVESEVGVGTTFSFELAFSVASGAEARPAPTSSANADHPLRAHILVAEDNPINAKVTERILRKIGCDVDLVTNGAAAVEASARQSYDLILMDCQMPVLDGLDATRQIREKEGEGGPSIPIVAFTASVSDAQRAECVAAGMSDFLPKPALPKEVRALLERTLRKSGEPSA